MATLQLLSQIYSGFVVGIIAVLFVLFSWRVWSMITLKTLRTKISFDHPILFPSILKLAWGISMIACLIWLAPITIIGSAFRMLVPDWLNWLLLVVAMLLALVEVRLAFSLTSSLQQKTPKKILLIAFLLLILPLSYVMVAQLPSLLTYPSEEDCYTIDLPIDGTWQAAHAGGSEVVNYHCAYPSQQYAMDIVKLDSAGRFFSGEGKELSDLATYGANILAPIAGTVVQVVDSLPDSEITFMPNDTVNPAGNHVVIKFEEDRYIFLAHLQPNSTLVKIGDKVSAGQVIGLAGNSGNTSWPHLHLHIQDRPTIDWDATAYPFRFTKMQRKRWLGWETVTDEFLVRNDRFRPITSPPSSD